MTTTSGTTFSGGTTVTTLFGAGFFGSTDRAEGFGVVVPKEEVFVDRFEAGVGFFEGTFRVVASIALLSLAI